jgi:hypothetical protein
LLPADERVELKVGVSSQWDGFARYRGGHRTVIDISDPARLDLARAFHLACHEGYPGHHVQHVLMDDALVHRRQWTEFQMTPAFGPHLLATEGAAEIAGTLAFPAESRKALYRDVLLPLAGLPASEAERLVKVEDLVRALGAAIPDIVASYLDSRISRAEAVGALENDAAVLRPDALVALAERRRTVVLAYPIGRALVGAYLAAGAEDPWNRLVAMFSEPRFLQ